MNSGKEKVVLLAHLESGFAESIATHLLQTGHVVIVSSKDFPKFEGLQAANRFHSIPYDFDLVEEVQQARDFILNRWHGLDVLVTSFHSNASGGFSIDFSEIDWNQLMNNEAQCQFLIAKSFIPLLAMKKDAIFVTIGDSSFDNPLLAKGLESLSFTFQLMLVKKMAYEAKGNTTVHSFFLDDSGSNSDSLTSKNVAEALVALIENIEWNKGNFAFGLNWRDRMMPLEDGGCVSGI